MSSKRLRNATFAGLICGCGSSLAQPVASEGYVDRLIDGGTLAPWVQQDDDGNLDRSGWPRIFTLSLRGVQQKSDGEATTRSRDLQLTGQLDTPLYGAWSLALTHREPGNLLFGRVDQRAMPFANGWRLDTAWGMVSTVGERTDGWVANAPSLSRFALPSTPIFGAQASVVNVGLQQRFSVAAGERYQLGVARGAANELGFERLGGRISSASAQTAIGPSLRATVSAISGNDSANREGLKLRADSALTSLAYNEPGTRIEANLVVSRQSSATRSGGWVDAERSMGAFTHRLSGYRFDRDLSWGSTATVGDVAGAGYRLGYRTRLVTAELASELFRPLSAPALSTNAGGANSHPWGVYSTANARYQYSSRLGFGGNASVRIQGGTAYLGRAYVDYASGLGQTQWQATAERSADGSTRTLFGLDHSFASLAGLTPLLALTGARLNVSTHVEHSTSRTLARRQALKLAAALGYEFGSAFSVDATVRSRRSFAGSTDSAIDATANLSWRVSPGFTLTASLGQSRGRFDILQSLDPLQPFVAAPITRSASRYVFVAANYSYGAGAATAPLGGRVGDAAGSIQGVVFFDENDNGRRDAGEPAAANLLVVLDGRFTARTDAQGRFEFPMVASGEHQISVPAENLPLPWTIVEPVLKVRVETRSDSALSIGATRLK